jgi:hypothetical protein
MSFYIFILCLNTIKSMIKTNVYFDFTDFQVSLWVRSSDVNSLGTLVSYVRLDDVHAGDNTTEATQGKWLAALVLSNLEHRTVQTQAWITWGGV